MPIDLALEQALPLRPARVRALTGHARRAVLKAI